MVVHQRPGGNSSIQIGGGYGGEDDRFGNKKNAGAVGEAKPEEKPAEEEKKEQEEEKKEEEKKEEQPQLAAGQRVASAAVGGAGQPITGETSVKVRAPPGGASSITF